MACEMRLQGEFAAIRLKGRLVDPRRAEGAGAKFDDARLLGLLRAVDVEDGTPSVDDLKDQLTVEAQAAFESPEVHVSAIRFERGSVEVLLILSAAATVVKDFGSIMQGLREMARIVPEPLKRHIGRRVNDPRVDFEFTREPATELRSGFLGAAESDEWRPARPQPQSASEPAPEEHPRGRWLTAYLLLSHAVLTAALMVVLFTDVG